MPAVVNELSRPVALTELGVEPVTRDVVATEAERAALSRRFGLPAIDGLDGSVTVTRQPGAVIRAEGRLTAAVRQVCVVTLEPFDQRVEDEFTLYFTDAPDARTTADLDLGPEDEDAPEPIQGAAIDCGEIVAQQLMLALDPFPRSPTAEAEGPVVRTESEDKPEKPFGRLRELFDQGR